MNPLDPKSGTSPTGLDILDAKILIVDDQEGNVRLLEHILGSVGYRAVTSTMDSREVCELHRRNDFDLIVLDLNMPHLDGFQVLEALKDIERGGYVSVLALTAQPDYKLRALNAGAKDFISKPFDLIEIFTRIRNLLEVRLLHRELRAQNEILEQRVEARTAELGESYREAIYTIARAAEYKDEDTGSHIKRVAHSCRELAHSLGMTGEFCDTIFHASPMHDVGKMGIPDNILSKQGALSAEEWAIMKTHAAVGAAILSDGRSPYLRMGKDIAHHHHERWDGGGYPCGLAGEAIPISARMMNMCDIYDALRSNRPYKPAWDHARALEIITVGDGRTNPAHFDPTILSAFARHHEIYRDIFEANKG
ncbi:MAG: HD domain-containing phosphohydrolase [Betaproteobacteria bacterium]